jgi:hypothetical protein
VPHAPASFPTPTAASVSAAIRGHRYSGARRIHHIAVAPCDDDGGASASATGSSSSGGSGGSGGGGGGGGGLCAMLASVDSGGRGGVCKLEIGNGVDAIFAPGACATMPLSLILLLVVSLCNRATSGQACARFNYQSTPTADSRTHCELTHCHSLALSYQATRFLLWPRGH